MHNKFSFPDGPSIIISFQYNINGFNIRLANIWCQHLTFCCPGYPVGISKPIGIDLPYKMAIRFISERILPGNTILSVYTIISHRVYPQNASPYFFRMFRKKGVTVFHTAAVTHANIELSVIVITPFGEGIKYNFLYTVNSRNHIDSHQSPAGTLECGSHRIRSFPFAEHPLKSLFYRIRDGEIRFFRMGPFTMCRIENPVPGVVRMKGKTSKTRGQPGLINKIRFPFGNVQP